MRRLMEVGAAGLIVGGMVEKEVSACLGIPAEDRLSAWRVGPTDVGIGDHLMSNLALVATEGFGSLPMPGDAFAFLKHHEGQHVSLLTSTRITGFLARPQVVVVNVDALDEDAPAQPVAISDKTRVRLVDQAGLGAVGTIAELPKRSRRADGILVDVMTVAFSDGKARTVAKNNVEIFA